MKALTNSRVAFASRLLISVKEAVAALITILTTVFGTQDWWRVSDGRSSSVFQSKTQISVSAHGRSQIGLR